MCPQPVSLRPATDADADLLLAWRNDELTRRFSRNTDPVDAEDHQRWLAGKLASEACRLMIAEVDGTPVGVVRADELDGGWELSWTVAPQARGRGVGSDMLRRFVALFHGRLTAIIDVENAASKKMATAAGLRPEAVAPGDGFEAWVRD